MRWPWKPRETRQSGGGYTDAVVAALEAQAAATVADVSSTAAIEAAAGALSRAFMAATVEGPGWARDAINPVWLSQVGRSLIREGASLSVIVMGSDGAPEAGAGRLLEFRECQSRRPRGRAGVDLGSAGFDLRPVDELHAIGEPRPAWCFLRWGTSPGTRYRGQGPTSWAHLTARLQGELERSLADEAAGPLAQLLAIPADGGDGDEDTDPLAKLKADLGSARGRAMLVETTAAGFGEGRSAAPQSDWKQSRLGPQPPAALVAVADAAFARMLAACGCPPSLFAADADGTAQREGLRRFHLGTVVPIARMLERELTARLEADVRLRFDTYPTDLAGRAGSFQKLVASGMDMAKAAAITGLLIDAE